MTDFPTPLAIVDVVLLTLSEGALRVLLAYRDREPEMGRLALPGGFIHVASSDDRRKDEDEDVEATARRVLREKIGVEVPYLEQLFTFSGRKRDRRGWTLAVSHYALVQENALVARDPATTLLAPVDALPELPFDHNAIIAKAVLRLRSKATYSSLPLVLMPAEFTLNEMEEVYQILLGNDGWKLDKASFRRFVMDQDIVEPTGGRTAPSKIGGRPSQLFKVKGEFKGEVDRFMVGSRSQRRS